MPHLANPRVFISYRRLDSADVSGRIYDRLHGAFGKENIFKDVDSIPYGAEFEHIIAQTISACDYIIVVIGRHWEAAQEPDGTRRLDNPNDLVRLEIEQALKQGKTIIPTLVSHAMLPSADSLPESIRALLRRNGVSVRPDPDFHSDMDRLIRGIATGRLGFV